MSALMSATNFHTLVEALLQAPSFRPFITMWHNEDNVQRVSFGELIYLAKLQSAEFHAHGVRSGDSNSDSATGCCANGGLRRRNDVKRYAGHFRLSQFQGGSQQVRFFVISR